MQVFFSVFYIVSFTCHENIYVIKIMWTVNNKKAGFYIPLSGMSGKKDFKK